MPANVGNARGAHREAERGFVRFHDKFPQLGKSIINVALDYFMLAGPGSAKLLKCVAEVSAVSRFSSGKVPCDHYLGHVLPCSDRIFAQRASILADKPQPFLE